MNVGSCDGTAAKLALIKLFYDIEDTKMMKILRLFRIAIRLENIELSFQFPTVLVRRLGVRHLVPKGRESGTTERINAGRDS